jgi:hypothetical protein
MHRELFNVFYWRHLRAKRCDYKTLEYTFNKEAATVLPVAELSSLRARIISADNSLGMVPNSLDMSRTGMNCRICLERRVCSASTRKATMKRRRESTLPWSRTWRNESKREVRAEWKESESATWPPSSLMEEGEDWNGDPSEERSAEMVLGEEEEGTTRSRRRRFRGLKAGGS